MAQLLPSQRTNWTLAALEPLAARDEWHRYEIIAGELFVSRAPHWGHQRAIRRTSFELEAWSQRTGLGEPMPGSGLVFPERDSVIPDAEASKLVSPGGLAILESGSGSDRDREKIA